MARPQIQFVFNTKNQPNTIMRVLPDNTQFEKLREVVSGLFPSYEHFDVSYQDEEGDYIKITTNMEFKEALSVAAKDGNFLILDIEESSAPEKVAEERAPEPENPLKPFANAFCNFFGVKPDVRNAIEGLCDNVNPHQIAAQIEELVHDPEQPESESVFEEFKTVFDSVKQELSGVILKAAEVLPKKVEVSEPVHVSEPVSVPISVPEPEVILVKKVEPEPQKVIHHAQCDHCESRICGIRYKCLECPDYDLCESCESLNAEGHIHDQNHCFAKLRTTQQQVCTGDRFRGFRRHRARAHDRLNSLEKDVSDLKDMISQLSQQRAESQLEYNYYSDELPQEEEELEEEVAYESSEEEVVIPVQQPEVVVDEPAEVVVDEEPLQIELDQDEDAEKNAALNILREMGIEIDQGVEFLLAENDNDVETVLSMIL